MMDDATLHDLLQSEYEFYEAVERRRNNANTLNESRDVLAHYDELHRRSIVVLHELTSMRYRKEYEEKTPPARQR